MGLKTNLLIFFYMSYILLTHKIVDAVVYDCYFPKYHLAPPGAWCNDPCGFAFYKSKFYLSYQHNPYSSFNPGTATWRTASSKDLFYWDDAGIILYPDKPYDDGGVFTGGALVDDDILYLYYTGNVNLPGQTPEKIQRQALAISTDGISAIKYMGNPIVNGSEFQPDFRDPKVFKRKGIYYMVLANSFNNATQGRILLYSSKDKINWTFQSVLIQSDKEQSLGTVHECPDFFPMKTANGTEIYVLLFSAQGIKPQGDRFRNIYQTGYILGSLSFVTNIFVPLTKYILLDRGHDFYATQTIQYNNERILVAWLNMWKTSYPDQPTGFSGQMTLPRRLYLSSNSLRLIQKPVQQIQSLRSKVIYMYHVSRKCKLIVKGNAAEINITSSSLRNLELYFDSQNSTVVVRYNVFQQKVTLDRGGNDGIRRATWRPAGKLFWNIFLDSSSIEVFFGYGELTMSSRMFPIGPITMRLGYHSVVDVLAISSLRSTVYVNDDNFILTPCPF